jgi:Rrf2 family protein
MSIFFSRQCELAIQAVVYLAFKPYGEMTRIRELTQQLNIPYHFVAKILQDLTRKGLLMSMRGPSGGFALGMAAEDITLFHIVEAIDGVGFMHNCLLGFPECAEKNRCAVHNQWVDIRNTTYNMLIGKSIAEMANDTRKPQYNLAKRLKH